MDRKEAVQYISILLGGTLVGANSFLAGCKTTGNGLFTQEDITYLNELADTVLPPTDTPGAKEANVGQFISRMITDCYDEKEQQIFMDGMNSINEISTNRFGHSFMKITPRQRHELLMQLDTEQKKYMKDKKDGEPVHYFRMMKELTLLGYFTSKPGCTQAKRYMPVPGKYIGCVPYKKGDKAIV
ncbi:MAG: gluconate 2-dehydrogenase subunit 3 family protein [Chitinophagaceae bacterium]